MTLSVAMCTYNGAKYIEEQLQSILDQELPVGEIVVCDDGSKDDTINIVKGIASKHAEIVWNIQENIPNLGVTKNFEKAISLCTGDYIFLSDQDDVWYTNKTKVIVDFFNNHPNINIVFSDADIIDEKGKLLTRHSLLEAWNLLPDDFFWESYSLESMMFCNRATGATMAFRQFCSEDFLPFDDDTRCLHDYQIAMYACVNDSLGLIKVPLIQYRQHDKNVMGVSQDNWIYSKKSFKMPLILEAIEPVPIRPFCKKYKSPRLEFYRKRVENYHSIRGKIVLVGLLSQYISFYKAYWRLFFFSDFLYGFNNRLRKVYIKHYINHENSICNSYYSQL